MFKINAKCTPLAGIESHTVNSLIGHTQHCVKEDSPRYDTHTGKLHALWVNVIAVGYEAELSEGVNFSPVMRMLAAIQHLPRENHVYAARKYDCDRGLASTKQGACK